MKAILEYNTEDPEQNKELLRAVKADDMSMFIWELVHNFWRKWKHDESKFTLDNYREELADLLIEYHINVEDLE